MYQKGTQQYKKNTNYSYISGVVNKVHGTSKSNFYTHFNLTSCRGAKPQ